MNSKPIAISADFVGDTENVAAVFTTATPVQVAHQEQLPTQAKLLRDAHNLAFHSYAVVLDYQERFKKVSELFKALQKLEKDSMHPVHLLASAGREQCKSALRELDVEKRYTALQLKEYMELEKQALEVQP